MTVREQLYLNIDYTYTQSGTYNVCLTITTDWGCTGTVCDSITVSDCAADFSYTVILSDGFCLTFTNELSTDFGEITAWNWTVDGQTTSLLQNPAFTLPGGTYVGMPKHHHLLKLHRYVLRRHYHRQLQCRF